MATEEPPDDPNVAQFPDERQRRKMLLLKAANDKGATKSEPILNMPPVIKYLSLTLIVIFLAEQALPHFIGEYRTNNLIYLFGFIPARYTGGSHLGLGAFVSPVTHLFLHGGWAHLGINLISLMAFGSGIERWLGGKKFLVIYFASGFIGAAVHFMMAPHLDYPMIGASGAISGLFGALIVLLYDRGYMNAAGSDAARGSKSGLKILLPFVLVWVGSSLFFGWFGMPGSNAVIAWATHIGGFLGGMALSRPVAQAKF